jgi:hypothetical protein
LKRVMKSPFSRLSIALLIAGLLLAMNAIATLHGASPFALIP